MKFSIYETAYDKQPKRQISLKDAYEIVSTGTYLLTDDIITKVARVRTAPDKPTRDKLKKQLPVFVFSGEFTGDRAEAAEYTYSQLMCIDIDNLDPAQVTTLSNQFKEWSVIHLMFVSPSGNGLKLVFLVDTDRSQHRKVYKALMLKIRDKFGLPLKDKDNPNGLDTVCKDIARACYVSYDTNAYYDDLAPAIPAKQLLKDYAAELVEPVRQAKNNVKTSAKKAYKSDLDTVEYIVSELEAKNISLSTNHDENIAIGWALHSVNAPAEYFHRITKLNPDYDFAKMEKRYSELGKTKNEYTIGTLCYMAMNAGVVLESQLSDIQYATNWLKTRHEFRTNEISGKIEYRATAKGATVNANIWKQLEDPIFNGWYIQLREVRITTSDSERKLSLPKSDLYDLINNYDFSPKVNPILEHFKQLHSLYKFDDTNALTEVNKWIVGYNYGNHKYAKDFWMDWFYGVIKNLTTESYYDKILVLSGVGGSGKTYGIKERLCSPFRDYLTTNFKWSDNKDDLSKIAKYLFILDDELNTSRKADVEQIKNITSLSHIDYREAYARLDSRKVRIANFIATTNNKEFLTDLTGNRRFLVLDVLSSNRNLINTIDYNRLWAEVWNYYYIQKNEPELSNEAINENNEEFRSISVEEEALLDCFDFSSVGNGKAYGYDFAATTVKEIIDYINSHTGRRFVEEARTSNKIKAVLRSKGIEQPTTPFRHNGKLGRWWCLKLKTKAPLTVKTFITDDFLSAN